MLPLSAVIGHSISREADAATRSHDRLLDLAAAVQFLTAATTRPGPGEVEHVQPLDGEISAGGNPLQLLTSIIEDTSGDLLWLTTRRLADAAGVGDGEGGRRGGGLGTPVPGDLPGARTARRRRTRCAPAPRPASSCG